MNPKNPLDRYFSILEGNEKARYFLCENLKEKLKAAGERVFFSVCDINHFF